MKLKDFFKKAADPAGIFSKPDTMMSKLMASLAAQQAAKEAANVQQPPSVEQAAQIVDEEGYGKRKKRGRASTMLTGPEGAGLPTTATKTLLGG